MRVVVLVPRRSDNGRRDELWQWIRDRWTREHLDFQIFVGSHEGEQPFNRSLAINRAAAHAGTWDVAIIADADSFCSTEQIDAAIKVCADTGQMTLAYDRWVCLNHEMTNQIMAGYIGDWYPGVEFTMTGTCSSMVVVTRDVWDECEGFDEGFDRGWSCEDIAFSHAAQTFGGGLQRVPGEVWHMNHPSAPRLDVAYHVARSELYAQASYDKVKMRALIAELKAAR
jgi:hypothetical protein